METNDNEFVGRPSDLRAVDQGDDLFGTITQNAGGRFAGDRLRMPLG